MTVRTRHEDKLSEKSRLDSNCWQFRHSELLLQLKTTDPHSPGEQCRCTSQVDNVVYTVNKEKVHWL